MKKRLIPILLLIAMLFSTAALAVDKGEGTWSVPAYGETYFLGDTLTLSYRCNDMDYKYNGGTILENDLEFTVKVDGTVVDNWTETLDIEHYTQNKYFKYVLDLNEIGEYKIYVTRSYDDGSGEVVFGTNKTTFYVVKRPEPKKIRLNYSGFTITRTASEPYPTFKLKATVEPENAYGTVKWSSSDTSVATVSSKGKVTALREGYATITAKVKNSSGTKSYKATCLVEVLDTHLKSFKIVKKGTTTELNYRSLSLKKGKTVKLQVIKMKPLEALNTKLKWYSNDTYVADVTSKGVVTAKHKGTCRIYVKSLGTPKLKPYVTIKVK